MNDHHDPARLERFGRWLRRNAGVISAMAAVVGAIAGFVGR
ncbi:hypothetical protein ACI1MP_37255 (plasmid) [Kitasatospora griseola]